MGLPAFNEGRLSRCDTVLQLPVAMHQCRSLCTWCVLVKLVVTFQGMEIRKGDVQSYQVVAIQVLEIAKQRSRILCLWNFFLRGNPPAEYVAVWRYFASSGSVGCFRKLDYFMTGGVDSPKNTKVGSKRGLIETGVAQRTSVNGCVLSIGQRASKRVRHLGKYVLRTGVPLNICNSVSSRPGTKHCVSETSEVLSNILDFLCNLNNIVDFRGRLFSNKKPISVPAHRKIVEVPKRLETPTSWGSLPDELQKNILQRVEFKDLFRFKRVSKSCKEYVESDAFRECRGAVSSESEGLFTAINYYIKNEQWRCSGFDLKSGVWRPLPSFFPALPAPDPELFKEYPVCGHGALICADIAKPPQKGRLVVLNPLTHKKRELPPLLYPRSPVLVHLWVDSVSGSFKVIVAGSSASSDEKLSRKVEVFDSEMSVWEEAPELPGPKFGLNEHQAGVCVDGVLHLISFLDSCDGCRGVVAFDVKSRKWLSNKACPILFSSYSNTLQLVETKGKVYLFSEQERAGSVEHCIDVLEMEGKCKLKNVVRVKKSGGRGLQVYPEHTCVSFGDEKLCIFNTLTRGGVVYDMRTGKEVQPALEPPPFDQKGDNFFSLNPTSFLLQPSFNGDPK